jgi:type II secretory pathway pseudopilin PulG
MNPNRFKRVKALAFTLAEVLIAITIVGIISALVLPMLVSNSYEHTIDKGFQRETKLLEQTLSLDAAIFSDTKFQSHDESEKFIKKYFKVNKYCGTNNGNCFAKKYYEYNNKNKTVYTPEYKGACASLKNGMSICLSSDGKGSTTAIIDINGKKGPNIYGRDLRVLTMTYDAVTKAIATTNNSSTVYYNNVKITTPDTCNGENDLSLDCCRTLNISENTGCCVNSEIADEYPNICNKQIEPEPTTCSSSDTSEECCLARAINSSDDVCCNYASVKKANTTCLKETKISYKINCSLSLDMTSMYTIRCTVDPQKIDTLNINVNLTIIKNGKNNGNSYSNRYDQMHTITEDNLSPSKSAYIIEAGAPFNFDTVDNEVIRTIFSIDDCSLSYQGYWMDAIPDTTTSCSGTLYIEE